MVATTTVPPYQVCHQVDSISISERERVKTSNVPSTYHFIAIHYTSKVWGHPLDSEESPKN